MRYSRLPSKTHGLSLHRFGVDLIIVVFNNLEEVEVSSEVGLLEEQEEGWEEDEGSISKIRQ